MGLMNRCPFCRAFIHTEDRFCWSCGKDLMEQDRAPFQSPKVSPRHTYLPNLEVELEVRRAYLSRKRGNLNEAERLTRNILKQDPQNVPALSLLSELLRAKGDLIGAVDASQRATEASFVENLTPGSLEQARKDRAEIQESVVREIRANSIQDEWTPANLLASVGSIWYRSILLYLALAALGVVLLAWALRAAFSGHIIGYIWLLMGLLAAGWCYQDAEIRNRTGLFWGPVVLFLGPFGLAIYLLIKR